MPGDDSGKHIVEFCGIDAFVLFVSLSFVDCIEVLA